MIKNAVLHRDSHKGPYSLLKQRICGSFWLGLIIKHASTCYFWILLVSYFFFYNGFPNTSLARTQKISRMAPDEVDCSHFFFSHLSEMSRLRFKRVLFTHPTRLYRNFVSQTCVVFVIDWLISLKHQTTETWFVYLLKDIATRPPPSRHRIRGRHRIHVGLAVDC